VTHSTDPSTYTFTPNSKPRDTRHDAEIDTGLARIAELKRLDQRGTLALIRYVDSL
jgi:hypothetical protein